MFDLAINLGQISKKNPIQVIIGMETITVNQMFLKSNQLLLIILIPVRSIDQGLHHQGL